MQFNTIETDAKYLPIDDVNDTIARMDIRVDNLGHIIARVAGTLLINAIKVGMGNADGSAVFPVGHMQQFGASQISLIDCIVGNGME